MTGASVEAARRVFDLFAVQAERDDAVYVPTHFAPYALREMGLYPTTGAVSGVLTRAPLARQGRVTFGLFVQLCEEAAAMASHMSPSAIHAYVSQLDLHEDGVLSRAEFSLLVGGGAATVSFSEMDAILDLLDPTRSDSIRLMALEEVLLRGVLHTPTVSRNPCAARIDDATPAVRLGRVRASRRRDSVPYADEVTKLREESGRLRRHKESCLVMASAPLPHRVRQTRCASSRRHPLLGASPMTMPAQNGHACKAEGRVAAADDTHTEHATVAPQTPGARGGELAVHSLATTYSIPAAQRNSASAPHVSAAYKVNDADAAAVVGSACRGDGGDESPDVRVSERAPTAPFLARRDGSGAATIATGSPQPSPPPQPPLNVTDVDGHANAMGDDRTCAPRNVLPNLPQPRPRQWAAQKQDKQQKCCVVC